MVDNFSLRNLKEKKFADLDKLDPDMILALEEMIGRKQAEKKYTRQDNNTKYIPYDTGKPSINLSDTEFGKY
jgi:hypothetical protein